MLPPGVTAQGLKASAISFDTGHEQLFSVGPPDDQGFCDFDQFFPSDPSPPQPRDDAYFQFPWSSKPNSGSQGTSGRDTEASSSDVPPTVTWTKAQPGKGETELFEVVSLPFDGPLLTTHLGNTVADVTVFSHGVEGSEVQLRYAHRVIAEPERSMPDLSPGHTLCSAVAIIVTCLSAEQAQWLKGKASRGHEAGSMVSSWDVKAQARKAHR